MLSIQGKHQYIGMYNFGCDWQNEEFCHAHIDDCQVRHRER